MVKRPACLHALAVCVTLLICACGCAPGKSESDDSHGRSVQAGCAEDHRNARYSLRETTRPGEVDTSESFRLRLAAGMPEPPLVCAGGEEAYRVRRTLTIDPLDVTILVIRSRDNRILLRSTVRNRTVAETAHSSERTISIQQLGLWTSAIKELDFWNQSVVEIPRPQTYVLDGGTLVLEGFSRGRYHVITRSVDDPGLSEVAKIAFELSGVNVESYRQQ
jgi:hypothetical protein